jgi:glycosyltransferase involved in cell wall biosynthesis
MDLTVIEMSGKTLHYAWDAVPAEDGFRRMTLFPECDCTTLPRVEVLRRLEEALDEVKPDVVAIPSWGDAEALAALWWSLKTGTPNLVRVDSNQHDRSRWFFIEAVKRLIVGHFQAALVAGLTGRAYLEALGMPRGSIQLGLDVVDNDYFAKGAAAARADAVSVRRALGLPERYFLCSARYIWQKNLLRLLEAFARYRRRAGDGAWSLVLLGDGELHGELERRCAELGTAQAVVFTGFKQYNDLPPYYALAGAFVLASVSDTWGNAVNEAMACGLPVLVSKRCGCATTLVHEGKNGFTFDPLDVDGLANLMLHFSSGEVDLAAMGQAGREIIGHWTPDTYAEGLLKSAEHALAQPRPHGSRPFLMFLKVLARLR